MTDKVKTNARIGRVYYQANTDAAGYPNGLATWRELPPTEKYYLTQIALQTIQQLIAEGIVTARRPFGTGDSCYGDGECAELMKYFEEETQ